MKNGSPSPREFGRDRLAIGSNVIRIHEERGMGGEEQTVSSRALLHMGFIWLPRFENTSSKTYLPSPPDPLSPQIRVEFD